MRNIPHRKAAWAQSNKDRKTRVENLNRAIPATVNRIQASDTEEAAQYRSTLQDMLTVLKEISPLHPHLKTYKAYA